MQKPVEEVNRLLKREGHKKYLQEHGEQQLKNMLFKQFKRLKDQGKEQEAKELLESMKLQQYIDSLKAELTEENL